MTIKNIKTEINAVISDDDVLALDEYFKKTEKCISKKLKQLVKNKQYIIPYLISIME